jgi:hypothetical protein
MKSFTVKLNGGINLITLSELRAVQRQQELVKRFDDVVIEEGEEK